MNSFQISEGIKNSTGGIDWKFIASIYPADLLISHDKYTMKTIIQDFMKTQSFEGIPSNLTANFLYILQIIMKRLLENQKKTQKKLENQIRINEALKKKNSKKDYDYSDDEIVKDIMDKSTIHKSKMSCFLCPVCMNCYTSLKYLDMHFFTHHNELSDIWQILRTPHYDGFTTDPTTKLIATSTEKSQLRQTIQFLGEEVFLESKNNEMKIKNYFRKKFLKVNNKLDQISSTINYDSINNYSKIHSLSNKIDYHDNENNLNLESNGYDSKNSDFTSEKFEYASDSNNHSVSYDNDNEVVININQQNHSNDTNTTNDNNINMANTNFTTSTNIFVISDSDITENGPEIKNASSPISPNYKVSPTSPNYQFSSNNVNSFSSNRIESNMISADNQTFTNNNNLETIYEESNEDDKPKKVSKIKSRRKDRIKKAVLETDSSYNDS